ncbi:MAG TPA: prephenate dehydratase domain-containing protein [Candidatus Paceibacterota bacterium]|nr:prephenate dehydratase domain-containing protein [Candidatus Paceibacterota bacterium]
MKGKTLVIGIQGGRGSFNEEAIRTYTKEKGIIDFRIEYLYTTRRVLEALHDKKIDRGQFAIENTIGGTVWETINALSEFNCKILDNYKIPVRHCLLARPGMKEKDVKTIMSHPQALAQTKKTVARRYPGILTVSGEGILVDQATAAEALAKGKLPEGTAVIASRTAGEINGLSILRENLQDKKKNLTTFLFVSRFKKA